VQILRLKIWLALIKIGKLKNGLQKVKINRIVSQSRIQGHAFCSKKCQIQQKTSVSSASTQKSHEFIIQTKKINKKIAGKN
jgi:hypothetical protein